MATFRLTGLDKFQKKLQQLRKNAKELNGKHSVPFDELFSEEFMRTHSSFSSMQAMLDASPFKDMMFKDIPDIEWDVYVSHSTDFKSWKDMKAAGTKKWAAKKLMKGVS